MRWFWIVANFVRGLGFTERCAPRPGTCPYPIHPDWSAKGCIKRGDCGCDNKLLEKA